MEAIHVRQGATNRTGRQRLPVADVDVVMEKDHRKVEKLQGETCP